MARMTGALRVSLSAPAGLGREKTHSRQWYAIRTHWTKEFARNSPSSCRAPEQDRIDETTSLFLSRSAERRRCRGPPLAPGKRQAPGGRTVADADAEHALRAARSHHRPEQDRSAFLFARKQWCARSRRHDPSARPRIFRNRQIALPPHSP